LSDRYGRRYLLKIKTAPHHPNASGQNGFGPPFFDFLHSFPKRMVQ